jgi:hypothetical protein
MASAVRNQTAGSYSDYRAFVLHVSNWITKVKSSNLNRFLLSYSVNMKNLAGLVANTVLPIYAKWSTDMRRHLSCTSRKVPWWFLQAQFMQLCAYEALPMPNSKADNV